MRVYALWMAGLCTLLLLLFGLTTWLEIPWLVDPRPLLHRAGGASLIGVFLLLGDVVLPTPSSLVMVAHGALFGVPMGTALSLLGTTGAAATGFYLGRRAEPILQGSTPPRERERAQRLLAKWGALAVALSRPIPILAESVSLLAGTSTLSWGRFLGASLLGNLPTCTLLAVTGASATRLDQPLLLLASLAVAAALTWICFQRPED